MSAMIGGRTVTAQSTQPSTAPNSERRQDAPEARLQLNSPREASAAPEPKWEIEAHGGLSATGLQDNGAGQIPRTGGILGGLIGVSSFYFGDGARLFNQNEVAVSGSQPVPTITPLDPILTRSIVRRQRTGAFGVRVDRVLNHRLNVETTVDWARGRLTFENAALAGIEATRASFTSALARPLSTLPSTVTSVATLNDRQQSTQLFTTGALVIRLKTAGKVIPYVTIGGGVVVSNGDTPSATLVGKYQLGESGQIVGTDTVTLRYSSNTPALVWTSGGGLKYSMTRHWGIRLDARARLYPNSALTLVDATPGRALESTGAPFPLINLGALQFSSTAPLTGPPIAGFTTFAGTRTLVQVAVAVGLVWRL